MQTKNKNNLENSNLPGKFCHYLTCSDNLGARLNRSPCQARGGQGIKNKKAFTLVELIIVITILAILATIGFMSFKSYVADARDSNRITTMKVISSGLEMNFLKNSSYPMPDITLSTGSINGITYAYKGTIGKTVSSQLKMSEIKDPLSKEEYVYGITSNKNQYQIAVTLENSLANKGNITNTTYAAGLETAKVTGNYPGYFKYSSGSELWIANIPSLLWNNSGSVNLMSTGTYFVVDKKTNLPYKLNSTSDLGTKSADTMVQEITGTGVATLTGVNITSITSANIGTTFSGSLLASFGGDLNVVSTEVLGGSAVIAASTGGETPIIPVATQYVEDVFSTYLYTGNGSTQTINNGIDLAGKGGMVWFKTRDYTNGHALYNTISGINKRLQSHTTSLEGATTGDFTSFNSNGFTVGTPTATNELNQNLKNISSWTFAKAPKFFDTQTKVHTTGTPSTIDLSSLGTVGMVVVKSTVGTSNWFTWHKDLTTGNNLKLNLTDAQSTTNAYISVVGTTMTISSSAPSDTYVIYAWAHDTGTDGMIQAGSFTTDASGNASVNLGWEPQYFMVKASSGVDNWYIIDSMRGFTAGGVSGSDDSRLYANTSGSEYTSAQVGQPTATGFLFNIGTASQTYIYLAIRKPMKTPTSSSQVFNAVANSSAALPMTENVGFPADLLLANRRDTGGFLAIDRLRGKSSFLTTRTTGSESSGSDYNLFDKQNQSTINNLFGGTYSSINYYFKRAKGFFDVVAYTGDGIAGKTINHNLGVTPELIILKSRSDSSTSWYSGNSFSQSNYDVSFLERVQAKASFSYPSGYFYSIPTSTYFSITNNTQINTNNSSYIAYLFATLPGISKVGSYTGNGTNQTINAGFTAGAKYIMIKRTDSTGDWIVWDTARGIVAGTDPHISLNSTTAEVTGDDSIDPENSGFIVNQDTATNINVNNATYIYYSISQ